MRHFFFLTFLLFYSLSGAGQKSYISASPNPIEVTQPDGTKLTVFGKGDEFNHYKVTEDGYTILRDSSGYYEFARLNKAGNLYFSGFQAKNISERDDAVKKFLKQIPRYLISKNSNSQIKFKSAENEPQHSFPNSGARKVLMLLIKYPDLDSTYTVPGFHNMMNQLNYNGTGSFHDYYYQASDGNLSISVDVAGWYLAKEDYLYYGDDNGDSRAKELVGEAVDAAEAAGIDFSIYDNDGDGYVDNLIVVHSGPGAEEGSQTQYIWSHSWGLGGSARNYDGVTINSYVIQPETRSYGMVGIGVFCHEFGHALGLPDLYDTNDSNGDSEGLGKWALMASGAWLNHERTPALLSAWSREKLGWITPTVISAQGDYSLTPAASGTQCYKLTTPNSNEYFLLENRYKIGFDEALPGSGLAIFHINSNRSDNSDENNKVSDLEEADGLNQLDDNVNRGDAGDLFPGSSGNTAFNDLSNPDAQTYDNKLTGIDIKDITLDGSTLRFSLGTGVELGSDLTYNPTTNTLSINSSVIDVDMQVLNVENQNAGAFSVGYYLSSDTIITTSDYFVGSNYLSGLNSGESKNLNFIKNAATVNPVIPSGNYYVGYIIDYQNNVDELIEENNKFAFTSDQVQIVAISNLTFQSAQNNFVINGYDVSVNLQAVNSGSLASGSCKIGFYVSQNNPVTTSDYFIGELALPSLDAGETSSQTFSANVLTEVPSLPAGNYFVGYVIDYENSVNESNEDDNNFTYTGAKVDNYFIPNLTFTSNQNQLNINGSDISASMQVKNSGDLKSDPCKIAFYASQRNPVSTSGYFLGEANIEELNPNNVSTKSLQINVNELLPDLPAGNYYIGYIIDPNYVIEEENESDNRFTFNTPKLRVFPNLTFNATENTLDVSSTQINISLQVENSGKAVSNPTKIGYYLSADKQITTSDLLIEEKMINSLNINGNLQDSVSIDITSLEGKISRGGYYIGYIIDNRNEVIEEIETDNDFAFTDNIFMYCPPDATIFSKTICAGDSVEFRNQFYKTDGIYEFTFTGQSGCDSVIVLNLTVNPQNDTILEKSVCSGDSIAISNLFYKESGVYIETFTNQFGCDSVVTLNLEVRQPEITTLNESTCKGNPFEIAGSFYSETGTYTKTLTNSTGCDSLIVLNLTVSLPSDTLISKTICAGDSVKIGDSVYTQSGTFEKMLTNKFGCDSLVTLNLIVNPDQKTTIEKTICNGDSVTVGPFVFHESGTFENTFSNRFGCDSIIILHLTVNPITDSLLEVTLCEGDNVQVGNSIYNETGVYEEHLINRFGCDSLVTLSLTVNPVHNTFLEQTICFGDSVIVGNLAYKNEGSYTNVLNGFLGCDSTVTLQLTVHPLNDTLIERTICEGDSVVIGASSVYKTSGNYTDILSNKFGCDSTINLQLTVNPVSRTILNENICEGTIYTFDGAKYSESGSYEHHFSNEFGCDSTVLLNLNVVPLPVINLGIDFNIFASESVTLDAGNGFVSYLWNNGKNTQSVLVSGTDGFGIHTFSVSVADEFGCSGSDEIKITILDDSNQENDSEPFLKIFPNPSQGKLNLLMDNVAGEYIIRVFSKNGSLVYSGNFKGEKEKFIKQLNLSFLHPGIYSVQIISDNKIIVEKFIIAYF